MKKILFICVLSLFMIDSHAQDNENIVNNSGAALSRAANTNLSSFGSSARFVNPPRRIEGSVYMFEGWSNVGIIQTKDKKRVAFNNLNYNIRRNRIASRFSTDSLFVLDLSLLDKIIVQGRTFRKLDPDLDGRIFEVLVETEKVNLLSFHYLKVLEGSANPMVNRKVDKFKQRQEYYLYIDGDLIPVKLKKKEILKALAKNDEGKNAIATYMRQNKLSYKKKEDLKQLLNSKVVK